MYLKITLHLLFYIHKSCKQNLLFSILLTNNRLTALSQARCIMGYMHVVLYCEAEQYTHAAETV